MIAKRVGSMMKRDGGRKIFTEPWSPAADKSGWQHETTGKKNSGRGKSVKNEEKKIKRNNTNEEKKTVKKKKIKKK